MKKYTLIIMHLLIIAFFTNTAVAMESTSSLTPFIFSPSKISKHLCNKNLFDLTSDIQKQELPLKKNIQRCLQLLFVCKDFYHSFSPEVIASFLQKYKKEEKDALLSLLLENNRFNYEQKRLPAMILFYAGGNRSNISPSISLLFQAIDNDDLSVFEILIHNNNHKKDYPIDPVLSVLLIDEVERRHSQKKGYFTIKATLNSIENHLHMALTTTIPNFPSPIKFAHFILNKEEANAAALLLDKIKYGSFTVAQLCNTCISLS